MLYSWSKQLTEGVNVSKCMQHFNKINNFHILVPNGLKINDKSVGRLILSIITNDDNGNS